MLFLINLLSHGKFEMACYTEKQRQDSVACCGILHLSVLITGPVELGSLSFSFRMDILSLFFN